MLDNEKFKLRKIGINKQKVENIINHNREYSKTKENGDSIKIYKNKQSENSENFYICKIKFENEKNNIFYYGFLNKQFNKNSFGRITYPNNDFYSGELKEDLKNGLGIYNYNDKGFFVGKWENNEKKEGTYIWNSEGEKHISAFIGYFSHGYYNKGLYISLIKYNKNSTSLSQMRIKFIYFGEFDNYGKKNSENSFFYEVERNLLFYGSIKDDKVVFGYYYQLTSLDLDSNLEYIKNNIIYFDTNQNEENNSIKEVCKNPAIDIEEKERISRLINQYLSSFIHNKDWKKKIQQFCDNSKLFSLKKEAKTQISEHVFQQIENCKQYLKFMENIRNFEKSS